MSQRIVSLVPSLTLSVCDLGLREHLVGCTNFCIDPSDLHRSVTLIGGTKDPDLEKIAALKPSHILVNEEENKPEHIAACHEIGATFVSFPKKIDEVPALLHDMGEFLDCPAKAKPWAQQINEQLSCLASEVALGQEQGTWLRRRFLYYIWRSPYMVVSADTYINHMLSLLGFENAAPPSSSRYPELTVETARQQKADLVLLSTEPFPFRLRDAERLRQEWPEVPEIRKIDGKLCSWYGTLALEALQTMRRCVQGAPQDFMKTLI